MFLQAVSQDPYQRRMCYTQVEHLSSKTACHPGAFQVGEPGSSVLLGRKGHILPEKQQGLFNFIINPLCTI